MAAASFAGVCSEAEGFVSAEAGVPSRAARKARAGGLIFMRRNEAQARARRKADAHSAATEPRTAPDPLARFRRRLGGERGLNPPVPKLETVIVGETEWGASSDIPAAERQAAAAGRGAARASTRPLVRMAAAAGLVAIFAVSALVNPQEIVADAWDVIVANTAREAQPSTSGTIAGRASVIDGDTLEIRGTRIRLNGIDAPESRQTCSDGGGSEYRCGQMAAFRLADKVGSRNLACEVLDRDRYGRSVATCRLGETDVNGWMVASGWAIAYRQYSRDYVDEEAAARAAGAGIWAGDFTPPWEWRGGQR